MCGYKRVAGSSQAGRSTRYPAIIETPDQYPTSWILVTSAHQVFVTRVIQGITFIELCHLINTNLFYTELSFNEMTLISNSG